MRPHLQVSAIWNTICPLLKRPLPIGVHRCTSSGVIRASPNLKILALAQLPTSPSPSQETLQPFNRHTGRFNLFIMADTNNPAVVPPKRALTDYPVRFSSNSQLLPTRSILTLFAAHRLGPVRSTIAHILSLHTRWPQ